MQLRISQLTRLLPLLLVTWTLAAASAPADEASKPASNGTERNPSSQSEGGPSTSDPAAIPASPAPEAKPTPAPPPRSFRFQLGADALWLAGNLNQLQLGVNGLVSHNGPKAGNDLLLNLFRLWTVIPGTTGFTQVGDDLTITELPFYYLTPRLYSIGMAQYTTSQLRKLDHRLLFGGSVGIAPVRRPDFLIRGALGVFYEYSLYPSDTFSLDVSHEGNARSVPRLGVSSNGWFRAERSPVTFRYLAWFFLNPLDGRDYRYNLDLSLSLRVAGPLSLRAGSTLSGSTVVVEGVVPYDLRTTGGFTLQWPAR